jgi:hypothetical protein
VKLRPVPVTKKIIKGIRAVAIILFLRAPHGFVLFCPAGFDQFTIGFTRVWDELNAQMS